MSCRLGQMIRSYIVQVGALRGEINLIKTTNPTAVDYELCQPVKDILHALYAAHVHHKFSDVQVVRFTWRSTYVSPFLHLPWLQNRTQEAATSAVA